MRTSFLCLFAMLAFTSGCDAPDQDKFQFTEAALKGKTIFESQACAKCHYVGDEEANGTAPDLANPLLANDSLFIRTHLTFVEESKMPPIDISQSDIRFLGNYIAELHTSKYAGKVDNADSKCAVCNLPVNRDIAVNAKFYRFFGDRHYYFECEQCLQTFEKSPEIFTNQAQQTKQVTKS